MNKSNALAAGQWWLSHHKRPVLVAVDERSFGFETSAPIMAYHAIGCYEWYKPDQLISRLPDDAGFDYKPEPEVVFPVWKAPNPDGLKSVGYKKELAYFRYDDAESGETFHKDGTSFRFSHGCLNHSHLITVTKAEAEARVVRRKSIPEQCPDRWFIWSDDRYPIAFVKHASGQVFNLNVDSILKQSDDWHGGYEDQLTNGELVEVTEFSAKAFLKRPRSASQIPKSSEPDPEEWVTQDRVQARQTKDQWRFVGEDGSASEWYEHASSVIRKWFRHGFKDHYDSRLEIRCRRKDLPPLPESKPNRIPVRLYWYYGNVVACFAHSPPTDPSFVEIKLDPQMIISGSGFYVEGRIA